MVLLWFNAFNRNNRKQKKKKKMVGMGGRREEKDETGYTLITGCMNECEKIFKNLEKIMIKNSLKKKGG